MVERVDAFVYGKTTMRIIPNSVVKEASEEFFKMFAKYFYSFWD